MNNIITFVITIIVLQFQTSNKQITNKAYIIEQCSKMI